MGDRYALVDMQTRKTNPGYIGTEKVNVEGLPETGERAAGGYELSS